MGRRNSKKPVSSLSLISSILLNQIFSHEALVFGYERTYEFGKDCSINTTDVDENDKIYVEYNGKTVDFVCQYFKFRRRYYYGFLDEYSVCVTPFYFNDSDCAVAIDVKTSLSGINKHKIACIANKSVQYCGPKNETIFIEFKKRYGKDTNKVRFKLKITAKKDYDYNETRTSHNAASSGYGSVGVILGIVITVVWAAICSFWVFRRKQSHRRVFNPTQLYLSTEIPYVIYSAQTQQSMMTTPSNISSPAVYPMSSYAPPQSDTSPRTSDIKMSGLPPSYDECMTSHKRQETETIHGTHSIVKPATANPNVAYIDQTQQSTMATPSNISSPGVYPMASYPPPQRDASLWTDENKLLDPRPSYVALTKYSTSHVNTQIKRSIRV